MIKTFILFLLFTGLTSGQAADFISCNNGDQAGDNYTDVRIDFTKKVADFTFYESSFSVPISEIHVLNKITLVSFKNTEITVSSEGTEFKIVADAHMVYSKEDNALYLIFQSDNWAPKNGVKLSCQ